MSTNSTMINDRYCWNCKLADKDCDSDKKADEYGYCFEWTPEYNDDHCDDNYKKL